MSKKMQTADDYSKAPVPQKQPMTVYSKLVSPNQFQILDDFPPISYSQIIRSPAPPIKKPLSPLTPLKGEASSSSKPIQKIYFQKPNVEHITLTKFTALQDLQTLKRIISGFFPPECNWYSDDTRKTQQYYEYILVDTDSIELSHSMDPKDISKIAYSKCIIKKVFKSDDWISSPFTEKKFSKPYNPSGYTYPDYRMAWYRAFYKRSFDHSYFFSFHFDFIKYIFPIWFLDWWFYFGPTRDIIPNDVLQGLNYYSKEGPGELCRRELHFYAEFRVPWIMCWNFTFRQHYPHPMPISIVREFRIKWWQNYSTKFCNLQVVKHFLLTGEKPRWDPKQIIKEIPKENTSLSLNSPLKRTTTDTPNIQKTPSLSQSQFKIFELFEEDPETASQYLQFIKMKNRSKSRPASSAGSSSEDAYEGQFLQDAQDPFDFMM